MLEESLAIARKAEDSSVKNYLFDLCHIHLLRENKDAAARYLNEINNLFKTEKKYFTSLKHYYDEMKPRIECSQIKDDFDSQRECRHLSVIEQMKALGIDLPE